MTLRRLVVATAAIAILVAIAWPVAAQFPTVTQHSRAFVNVPPDQTDYAIVAAVTGKRICVVGYVMSAGTAVTLFTFNTKPSGAGTAISPRFSVANTGPIAPISPGCWFETSVGEGLTATTGPGSAAGVLVIYVER